MIRYAVLNSEGKILNIVIWNGEDEYLLGDGCSIEPFETLSLATPWVTDQQQAWEEATNYNQESQDL